ncbi:MAG: DNA replication/repair protein RecF [Sphingomonas sp.]|nr:DNA replication/repair protein RecF [Sphingomonas sp.]
MSLRRLLLTDVRNHASALIEPGPGFVLLSGPNGAGKTNVLEAVSLLAPGRGLRRAPYAEIARQGGAGGFSVAAQLDDLTEIGTGTEASAPERRRVRINGAAAAVNSLSERLAVLWLIPAMDRLFTGPASDRRRFLDRLVLALEPTHSTHAARYEAAMRARNTLLTDLPNADPQWLGALEEAMADHGQALVEARTTTMTALQAEVAECPDGDFPRAAIALEGGGADGWAHSLASNRKRDSAAGRATQGPHRQDLIVSLAAKGMAAAQSSTGEQKALLLGLVLAHAGLVTERRQSPPILLLDEVAAHLDPKRRGALFERLSGRGQIWLTATESSLFEGIGEASIFALDEGIITGA